MDVHGAGADARGEEVVLDLLVDGREDDHPDGVERLVRQDGDQPGQCDGKVGAHSGDELADQTHPQRQRQPVVQADQDEEDRREEGRDGGQAQSGDHEATRFLRADRPQVVEHRLLMGGKQRGDVTT